MKVRGGEKLCDWIFYRCLLALVSILAAPYQAMAASSDYAESTVNTEMFPRRILSTGVRLNVTSLSPNALQLSENIGLSPVLERVQTLRSQVAALRGKNVKEIYAA